MARIQWLPVGHVTHGYRRVFVVTAEGAPSQVISIAPMGYELVYRAMEKAGDAGVSDPSLLLGLSMVIDLLFSEEAWQASDDGYLAVRPRPESLDHLIDVQTYLAAVKQQYFDVEAVQTRG
ncbi:hypothetical protein LLE49_11415 [Alicyclobacillus tolerans]|uniref:hypothetical protein n=1 Tax=Alicyclobacillus tolerans TaxID=90970 RepID=UPI001F31D502|nr:hypothetical protein [Alicyclobacillus tolerans]MCF8565325.1 hypothetical protein [Alicyclobacillus tolerans]